MLKKIVRLGLPLAVALAFTLPSVSAQEVPKKEKSSQAAMLKPWYVQNQERQAS